MRAGWMRPSASSFSSVRRAISRRTPSKPDSTHRAGRVVDDEVDPGQCLERADVAALAADDAALQLVGLQLHDRDGGLDRVAGGHALHHGGQDAARAAVGVAARLLLDLADRAGRCRGAARPRARASSPAWPARAESPDTRSSSRSCSRRASLSFSRSPLEVALSVDQRTLEAGRLLGAQLQRMLLGAQALLERGDLSAPCAQLLLALAQLDRPLLPRARLEHGGRALGALPRRGRVGPRSSPRPLAAAGRCTTAPATAAATSAANTISIAVSLSGARCAGLVLVVRAVGSSAARRETCSDRSTRRPG